MVHNKSGFNIDPYHGAAAANTMADFFEDSAKNPDRWLQISQGSLARVQEKCALLPTSIRSHSGVDRRPCTDEHVINVWEEPGICCCTFQFDIVGQS